MMSGGGSGAEAEVWDWKIIEGICAREGVGEIGNFDREAIRALKKAYLQFGQLLTRIEMQVAPNERGHTPRGAADRVLGLLMDHPVYMNFSSFNHKSNGENE